MRSRGIALLLVLSTLSGFSLAQIYVDDNAPGDPLPFYRQVSDPDEDGSAAHPFDSIQEAIDAAVDGDTIIVAPGHYLSADPWEYDEIDFKGKNIRLVGSAPTDFTVIDQTVLCGVVVFDGIESGDCLLQGFKIQNHDCGGILGNGTQATVSHCIISGNGPCGATVVKDVQGPLKNCLIVDNTTFHNCGVLPVVSGCPEIVNCTIANNLAGIEITNVGLPAGRQVTVRNCIIYGNEGSQVIERWDASLETTRQIEYLLLENWSVTEFGTSANQPQYATIQYADPDFVRLGHWEDAPSSTRARRDVSIASGDKVLIEGDYHLKTEGWRWSPEPVHGFHWYFDIVTSPGIDGGDPMDSLGDELERTPDDPEGLLGVNHAINLGAYGGTTQASLAPRRGEVPGIGAVDLQDYWPLDAGNQWSMQDPDGGVRELSVSTQWRINEFLVDILRTTRIVNASGLGYSLYCVYVDRSLYMTTSPSSLDRLPQPPVPFKARYPQFLVDGATIQTPYDPFASGQPQLRRTSVLRGTLEEVLAGTSVDPAQFLAGPWPDVIAFRELAEDGTIGDPTTILARGFGPLMIGGQPIEQATVGPDTSGVGSSPATGTARR